MIPKVIHYCWFGGNPIPEKDRRYIEGWKEKCPDYEIIEWNERNYDVSKNKYMAQAYEEKKWGFVSDYARLDLVYRYGGIYFDTDVELLKPLDNLLELEMFCGFESTKYVNFGIGFGAEKENPVIRTVLEIYKTLVFKDKDRLLNQTACPIYQTKALIEYGLICNNRYQELSKCTVFPTEYFAPMDVDTGILTVTEHTYSIHRYNMSWFSKGQKKLYEKRKQLNLRYGKRLAACFVIPYRLVYKIEDIGIRGTIKLMKKRIWKT